MGSIEPKRQTVGDGSMGKIATQLEQQVFTVVQPPIPRAGAAVESHGRIVIGRIIEARRTLPQQESRSTPEPVRRVVRTAQSTPHPNRIVLRYRAEVEVKYAT